MGAIVNQWNIDMCPLVDNSAHDKEPQNRRSFSHFLQEPAAHVLNNIHTFPVAICNAVVPTFQTNQIEKNKEQ